MRADEILRAMEYVDDEMLEKSEAAGVQPTRRFRWKRGCVLAAGLAIFLLLGVLWNAGYLGGAGGSSPGNGDGLQEPLAYQPGGVGGTENISGEEETENAFYEKDAQDHVTVSALLASAGDQEGIVTQALKIARIETGGYTAIYEGIPFTDSAALEDSKGIQLSGEDDQSWYLIAGHEDKQYLIHQEEDGSYSLWEFAYFDSSSYPYADVLTRIYGLEDAADVAKIIVRPSNVNNTDAGKALQEEIGTQEISDPQEIASLYETWASMTCYGSNHWELIDNGSYDVDYQGEGEGGLDAIRQGRYLTIVTVRGEEIDRLKYTGISHMFYEYSGVAYDRLDEAAAAQVEAVLGI